MTIDETFNNLDAFEDEMEALAELKRDGLHAYVQNGELKIVGRKLDDHVKVEMNGSQVKVQGNVKHLGTFSSVSRIRFEGAEGSDSFANETALPAIVYGGNGSDNLYGGSGVDEIFGGDGLDVIFGGGGNDTLHGGDGVDIKKARMETT